MRFVYTVMRGMKFSQSVFKIVTVGVRTIYKLLNYYLACFFKKQTFKDSLTDALCHRETREIEFFRCSG